MKDSKYYRSRARHWLLRALLLWHLVLGAAIGGWNAHLHESGVWLFVSFVAGVVATGCSLHASAECLGDHQRAETEERWENRGSGNYAVPQV